MTFQTSQLLQGRLALITGAAGGIGSAIALEYARAGARVVLTDRKAEDCQAVVDQIKQGGGQAWAYALDVTDEKACAALAERVRAEVGAVDTLVNNAGVLIREGIDTDDVHNKMRHVLNVNVMGVFNPVHAWLPDLRRTHGCIVNIASGAAFIAQSNCIGYSDSKGAVRSMTQVLAVDLAPDGIRVNAIGPGLIETPMSAATRTNPARLEKFMQRTPLKRSGRPEEIAGPALFLASSMSSFVTGVTLPVDGGVLAN